MIYVAVAVLFVLAVVAVLAALRRRQSNAAIGMLSRETRKRDRSAQTLRSEAPPTGREIEKAAAEARSARVPATTRDAAPPVPYVPPDPETIGVSRRQFFNRTIVMLMSLSLSSFGVAVIAFLWPQGSGGFGSKIRVGLVSDVLADIRNNSGFLYKPDGRMWLTEYPNGAIEKAAVTYSPSELAGMTAGQQLGLDAGIVALYQKCPHLGCRVPECVTSQWFECPCHGSRYNQVGEKRSGPAPRGMDRFATEVTVDGSLIVDTGTVIQGPPIGTNTTGQEAEGAACIGQATGDH